MNGETDSPQPTTSEGAIKKRTDAHDMYLGVVPESLARLTGEFTTDPAPSAPIKLPDREELEVRLVNSTLLQRLDELRGDYTTALTFLSAAIGGVIGFFTNVVTSNQPLEKSGWVFIVLMSVFSLIFGALSLKYSRRAERMRRRIFDETKSSKASD